MSLSKCVLVLWYRTLEAGPCNVDMATVGSNISEKANDHIIKAGMQNEPYHRRQL